MHVIFIHTWMLYPLCLFWFIFLEGNWPTPTWTVWSSCSVTCGIGKRERTRSCDMPITEAVKYRCFEKDTETEKCSQLPCTGTYKKINKSRRCRNRCSETGYFFIKYIKTVVSWIFILQNNVSSHTFKRLSCINFFLILQTALNGSSLLLLYRPVCYAYRCCCWVFVCFFACFFF